MKKLLEADEIQALLGIHQNTLYRLCQRDETFPVRKIAGKYKAIEDELEAWVKNQLTFNQQAQQKVVQMQPRRGRPCLSGTSPQVKRAQ